MGRTDLAEGSNALRCHSRTSRFSSSVQERSVVSTVFAWKSATNIIRVIEHAVGSAQKQIHIRPIPIPQMHGRRREHKWPTLNRYRP